MRPPWELQRSLGVPDSGIHEGVPRPYCGKQATIARTTSRQTTIPPTHQPSSRLRGMNQVPCSSRGRGKDQPFFAVFNHMTSHQSRTMVMPEEEFKKSVQSRLSKQQIHDPAKAPVPPYYPDTPLIRRAWPGTTIVSPRWIWKSARCWSNCRAMAWRTIRSCSSIPTTVRGCRDTNERCSTRGSMYRC